MAAVRSRGLLPALGFVLLLSASGSGATEVLVVGDVNEGTRAALAAAVSSADGTDGPQPLMVPESPRPGMLGEALDEAKDHESRFDLAGALYAYRRGCLTAIAADTDNPDWASWEAVCEGAVRAAFGLGEQVALDEVLTALLTHRPGRSFPPETFPPRVAERADELTATLGIGFLRISGAPATVSLDGVPRGCTPLLLTDVPAGRHVVSCGPDAMTLELPDGGSQTVVCPIHPDPQTAAELLDQLRGSHITWALLGDEHGLAGMASGVWVFMGGSDPVGIHVGAVPTTEEIAGWKQAVAHVRRVPGAAD